MTRDTRPLDGLDLNLLVTLRALLREEGVSRAAERLGQTQPTVSRSLKSLRAVFDDPLLIRTGRGMALTPLAAGLRLPLERALGSLDRLAAVGEFDPKTDGRTFRVVLPDLTSVLLLPRLATRLLREAPSVRLQVVGSERGSLRRLLDDDVDLVVGGSPLAHPELYRRMLGGPSAWGVVLGPRHPAFHGTLDHEGWLASGHIQLTPGGRPDEAGDLDRSLAKAGRSRRVRLQLDTMAGLADVLEATPLLVSLPLPVAHRVAAGRDLRVAPHPVADPMPEGRLRMTWHAAHHTDSGDRWLRALVADAWHEVI